MNNDRFKFRTPTICDPLNAFYIPNKFEDIGNIHIQKDTK